MVAAATLVFEDRFGHLLEDPVWVIQVEFPDVEGSLFGRIAVEPGTVVTAGTQVKIVATKEVGPEHVAFTLL